MKIMKLIQISDINKKEKIHNYSNNNYFSFYK